MNTVLPPFTPVKGRQPAPGALILECWGRAYAFRNSLLPTSISSAGAENLLAAPITVSSGSQTLPAAALKTTRISDVRAECSAVVTGGGLTLSNAIWFEYDGVLFCELSVAAQQDALELSLDIPLKAKHARYAHFASGGFGAGGGMTARVEKEIVQSFYPVVWLGDFERGLCWFSEGGGDLPGHRGTDAIRVVPEDGVTHLRVRLTDSLKAGESTTVRFGLQATPVKPLHPRYPLNIFARDALWDDPPATDGVASVWWQPYNFFLDIPFHDPGTRRMTRGDAELRAVLERSNASYMPYMTPYTLTSEYAPANHYLREWELIPARHNPKNKRLVGAGQETPWTELWMSPASETYRKYYAWKFGDALKRTGMTAVYFDFGCAFKDRNAFHGAHGGYCILGMRDFYRRIAHEFVKAGVNDYTIVAHNSQAVQIPSFSFVTHFYNGEHLRTSSSPTLHEGRDYLDTLPLYWFGIEQSGLPWGIHGNMLVEFDEAEHLIERLGVHDETVTEYLWKRTPSVVMPILLHGCLPDGYRLSLPYYRSVVNTLTQFDIPSAVFHPYWRNQELVQVENSDFKASVYTRPESPRVLIVLGNLGDTDAETNLRLDLNSIYRWDTFALTGMKHVKKKGALMQVVEHVGVRDARILDVGEQDMRVWVRRHGMALVEAKGHIRVR